jgi:hypothetical protein
VIAASPPASRSSRRLIPLAAAAPRRDAVIPGRATSSSSWAQRWRRSVRHPAGGAARAGCVTAKAGGRGAGPLARHLETVDYGARISSPLSAALSDGIDALIDLVNRGEAFGPVASSCATAAVSRLTLGPLMSMRWRPAASVPQYRRRPDHDNWRRRPSRRDPYGPGPADVRARRCGRRRRRVHRRHSREDRPPDLRGMG